MIKEQGFWLAIDGVDAVGKTTQMKLVAKRVRDRGKDVVCVEEFSDSPLGEMIRLILAKNRFFSLSSDQGSPVADILTLMTDLTYRFETVINPALKAGKIVVSDRGTCSFIGYQTAHLETSQENFYLRGKVSPKDWVEKLVASSFICPNLTILFYLSEKEMVKRIVKRGGSPPLEEEKMFLRRVSEIMDELPEVLIGKVVKIDGEFPAREVTEKIVEAINLHFPP